jgi:flagellar motor switch protein FliM
MAADLNSDEINALMDAIQDGRAGNAEGKDGPPEAVVKYDLTSRDRIIRGQMPTLDAINEQVASIFGSGLSGRIRQSLRVTSSPSSLVRFGDFASVLAPPATVCVLTLGKTYGLCLAVLEPGLAESLLAAAMGDRKAQTTPETPARRDLTSVERFVLKRLLSILTEAMRQAWTTVMPIEPEVLRFETDPRMATIAPPQEAAIVCTFEFSEGITGRIQLAVPFTAVESEKKALSAPPKVNTGVDQRFAASLAEELARVRVELRAILGRSQSTLGKVLDLAEGDVVTLDTDERSALEILVEGRSKLMGTPGVSGANLSIVVDEPVRGPMTPAPDSKKTARPVQFSVA